MIVTLYIFAFGMSYMAVIQPIYYPQENEIVSEGGTAEYVAESFIVKNVNGEYILHSPGEKPYIIKEETAEVFISMGIDCREELIE